MGLEGNISVDSVCQIEASPGIGMLNCLFAPLFVCDCEEESSARYVFKTSPLYQLCCQRL